MRLSTAVPHCGAAEDGENGRSLAVKFPVLDSGTGFRATGRPFGSSKAGFCRHDFGDCLPQIFQQEGFADDEVHVG